MQIQRTFVTRYDRAEARLASRKTHCVFNILVWDDPLYASDRAACPLCLGCNFQTSPPDRRPETRRVAT